MHGNNSTLIPVGNVDGRIINKRIAKILIKAVNTHSGFCLLF